MGILDSLKGEGNEKSRSPLDEVETIEYEDEELEKQLMKPKKNYIKTYGSQQVPKVETVSREISNSNIVIINIKYLKRKEKELREFVDQIKGLTSSMGGAVALLGESDNRLIVTPPEYEIGRASCRERV